MYTDATNLGMTRCCWHSLVSSVSLQHLQQSPGSCGESRCASPGTERKAQHGSTTNSLIFFFTHPVRQVVLNLKRIRTVQYLKKTEILQYSTHASPQTGGVTHSQEAAQKLGRTKSHLPPPQARQWTPTSVLKVLSKQHGTRILPTIYTGLHQSV